MLKIFTIQNIRTHLIITFGLLLNALGWTAFLIPAQITGGGITGVSTLIFYATGFPLGITYLIINAVLVLISIKILGINFGVKTIFSVVALALLLSLLFDNYPQYLLHDVLFLSSPKIQLFYLKCLIYAILFYFK